MDQCFATSICLINIINIVFINIIESLMLIIVPITVINTSANQAMNQSIIESPPLSQLSPPLDLASSVLLLIRKCSFYIDLRVSDIFFVFRSQRAKTKKLQET